MAAAAAYIIIALLHSRRTIFRHPGHIGIFLYFSFFIPYAALEASSLGQLAKLSGSGSSEDLDNDASVAAQISSSAAFAGFFGIGFITKVVMLEMWSHIVKLHVSSSRSSTLNPNLQKLLRWTHRSFVWAVAATVTTYVVGFGVLTSEYIDHTRECARQQDSQCADSAQVLQQPCVQSQNSKNNLTVYEGVWAVIVLAVFTMLALFFKGIVFGMYVRAHRSDIVCILCASCLAV
jgi:hypothetical protein